MPKRPLSPSAQTSAAKQKYMTKFNSFWKADFRWCQASSKGQDHAYCSSCKVDFKICYGGRSDLSRHSETPSHKQKHGTVTTTPSVSSLFSSTNNVDKVAYAETVFSNFIAEHNLPFLIADHLTLCIKVMFPDSPTAQKFACKRTKTTHIVTQALAPHWDSKVSDMCKEEKFAVMIDESNDKGDNKKLNILVRVYNQTLKKIATHFVGIPTCNIGTSESIFRCLDQVFSDRQIPWSNCVGYSSDNCNVMIGNTNSVLTRVREKSPNVFNVGCVCHLANICAQKAVKTLPLPVDELLIGVFFHFYHSSVRQFYCTAVSTMIAKFPFKDRVLQTIAYLNPETKQKVSSEDVASLSDRFLSLSPDQRAQLEDQAADYILSPMTDLPPYEKDNTTLNQFWQSMAQRTIPGGQPQFDHLFKLSKVMLTIPHSNADTERTFSMLKKIQTDSRDNLDSKNIHSLLSVKINNTTDCYQYKPEPSLVKEAKSACTTYLTGSKTSE